MGVVPQTSVILCIIANCDRNQENKTALTLCESPKYEGVMAVAWHFTFIVG